MPTVSPIIYIFLTGAVCSLCFVAAILFVQFYRRTKDRLFICFAIAFGILALNNVVLLFSEDRFSSAPENPNHPLVYAPRLIAFILILYAIVDKNLLQRPPRNPS
jgi:hypothetical protein